MKKLIVTAIVFILLLTSCGSEATSILNYQKYPMTVTGTLIYDDNSYAVTISLHEAKNADIIIDSPPSLAGYRFTVDNSGIRIFYENMEIELNTAAVGIPIAWIADMLSLSEEDYLSSGKEKESNTALYTNGEWETTVYFSKDGGTDPHRIKHIRNKKTVVLNIDTFIIN